MKKRDELRSKELLEAFVRKRTTKHLTKCLIVLIWKHDEEKEVCHADNN